MIAVQKTGLPQINAAVPFRLLTSTVDKVNGLGIECKFQFFFGKFFQYLQLDDLPLFAEFSPVGGLEPVDCGEPE